MILLSASPDPSNGRTSISMLIPPLVIRYVRKKKDVNGVEEI